MKILVRTLLLAATIGTASAEPPPKGTRGFMFRDPTAPLFRVVVCESLDLLKQIVASQNHAAKFVELNERKNVAGERLCFAIRFVGDVLDNPVPLGKIFSETTISNVWGIHVRFGNFEGYALYPELIVDKSGKPVTAKAT